MRRRRNSLLFFVTIYLCFIVTICTAFHSPTKSNVQHHPASDNIKSSSSSSTGRRSFESEISESVAELALAAAAEADRKRKSRQFDGVIFIAIANVIFNALRPDGDIPLQMRFPRIMWEASIMVIATIARASNGAPLVCLLLALMLGSTALLDIFWWAPIFAFFTEYETCSGGWISRRECYPDPWKGYGRLIVSAQSLFGGLFYLSSSLSSWYEFLKFRDKQDVARQYLVLDAFFNKEKEKRQQITDSSMTDHPENKFLSQ